MKDSLEPNMLSNLVIARVSLQKFNLNQQL